VIRATVREKLASDLARYNSVLALWEGGSAALGWADEYSDMDLAVLYKLSARDEVWRAIDHTLEELGGVDLRWHDPKPFPKGGGKRIFRLKPPSSLLLEINLIPETANDLYNQPERYGQIIILFDRNGRLAAPPPIDERHRLRIRFALHQSIIRWQINYARFRKELARSRPLDAFFMHYQMTIRPLIMVLNMRYRPNRWDFELRYVKEELPPEIAKFMERLQYVPSPEGLEERFLEAEQLMLVTVKELEERGITPLDPRGYDISPALSASG
jgi:hypothetical protein